VTPRTPSQRLAAAVARMEVFATELLQAAEQCQVSESDAYRRADQRQVVLLKARCYAAAVKNIARVLRG
jgi:hypothetical protein